MTLAIQFIVRIARVFCANRYDSCASANFCIPRRSTQLCHTSDCELSRCGRFDLPRWSAFVISSSAIGKKKKTSLRTDMIDLPRVSRRLALCIVMERFNAGEQRIVKISIILTLVDIFSTHLYHYMNHISFQILVKYNKMFVF